VSGPPGSGKTTLARLISDKTGMELIYAGQVFRGMAKERGMSLEDFGRLAERDESIDGELDERMVKIARERDDIILDGRLTGYMTHKNGIPAFRVYVTAEFPIRVERIAGREEKDREQVEKEVHERERSEYERYMKYYGIDIRDTEIYDLVLDSSHMSPEALAERLLHEAGVSHAHKG
jgi:predicted cytidylate kinase